MKLTKTRKQIPTLRLSKNLLEELCKTLDSELKNIKKDIEFDLYKVEYEFSNSEVEVDERDSKLFLDNIPNEIGRIEMFLKSDKGDIRIEFGSRRYYDRNYFSVSGEDSTWVFGITRKLEQIFQRHKTNNHIFYTKKGWGIYLLCAIGLLFAIFLSVSHQIMPNSPNGDASGTFSIVATISGISIYSFWPYIFKRAFPIVELENSLQAKFKNLIPVFIVGVFSSIIASALFLFAGH